MRYRVNQIKLKPGQPLEVLPDAIAHALGRKDIKINNIEIVKESVDARKKPHVKLVYTVDFDCDRRLNLPLAEIKTYEPPFGDDDFAKIAEYAASENARPVVAGFGPAGMFAALMLSRWGMKPIIIERGERVEDRIKTVEKFWESGVLDTESNVQFGEGGAGTFSDGKLTTNVKDVRIRSVLEEFVEAGADLAILYRQKPHIGTDMLRSIVRNIRNKIISLGGEFRFSTRLDNIILDSSGNLAGIVVYDNKTGTHEEIRTRRLVLATGHSAHDTFRMLFEQGVKMKQKPFSIGLRIEHPQKVIDKAQFGDPKLWEFLGHAEYKLNYRCENGRGVYTFCMCPGGHVVNSSSEEGTCVTNGMSNSARDSGVSNSGLLVDVRVSDFGSDHPLAGFEFQRKYEKMAYEASKGGADIPKTTLGKFCADANDRLRCCLPQFAQESIIEAMPHLGRKLAGFDDEGSILKGVETRSSSPVRIDRDEAGFCSVAGIMPAGEGPGYAGGIMSAAVDGIKTAEKLVLGILK